MSVRDTSINAYHTISEISRKQREVLQVIANNGEASIYHIRVELGVQASSVSGRIGDLRDAGLIKEGPRLMTPTGKTAIHWQLSEQGEKLFGSKQYKMFEIRPEFN